MNYKLRHIAFAFTFSGVLLSRPAAQELNKLSAAETQASYDLLFNGTDLSNWHAYRLTQVTDAWAVKTTGSLGVRIENQNGNKLPILTNKKYTNFDLKIDIMTTAGGNSGLFTRYEEVATDAGNARSGPEFQICGPNHSDCVGPTKHFGSCYDMFGVKEAIRTTWLNPPGSWNQIRIVAYDSNYVHYGNGKKLLEYKIGTADYLRAYNESKYVSDGNNGRYYHIHAGGILLQHHGETGIAFRNAKAKELNMHPFKREFPDGKWPETLAQEFAFGNPPTAIGSREKPASPLIAAESGPAGATLVKVPSQHSGFQAWGTDGRAVPHRKISAGLYSLNPGRTAGIVIVRLRSGDQLLTSIVHPQ